MRRTTKKLLWTVGIGSVVVVGAVVGTVWYVGRKATSGGTAGPRPQGTTPPATQPATKAPPKTASSKDDDWGGGVGNTLHDALLGDSFDAGDIADAGKGLATLAAVFI
jgi:hypothetical protein